MSEGEYTGQFKPGERRITTKLEEVDQQFGIKIEVHKFNLPGTVEPHTHTIL